MSEERAAAAFAAEIYYLDHHLEGSDPAALDELRDRCARIVADVLDLPALDHAEARRAVLERSASSPTPRWRACCASCASAGMRSWS